HIARPRQPRQGHLQRRYRSASRSPIDRCSKSCDRARTIRPVGGRRAAYGRTTRLKPRSRATTPPQPQPPREGAWIVASTHRATPPATGANLPGEAAPRRVATRWRRASVARLLRDRVTADAPTTRSV